MINKFKYKYNIYYLFLLFLPCLLFESDEILFDSELFSYDKGDVVKSADGEVILSLI